MIDKDIPSSTLKHALIMLEIQRLLRKLPITVIKNFIKILKEKYE